MRVAQFVRCACAAAVLLSTSSALHAQGGPVTPGSAAERLNTWAQTRPGEPMRAMVAFGSIVPDAQVEQFLRRHGIVPIEVNMFAAGQTGVHRVNPARATVAVIADARRITATMKEQRSQATPAGAREFVRRYPRSRVLADTALQRLTRSMLTLRESHAAARDAARGGAPIIYGLTVQGPVEAIRQLMNDPMARTVEPAFLVQGRIVTPTAPLPEALTPAQAYDRVEALGRSSNP